MPSDRPDDPLDHLTQVFGRRFDALDQRLEVHDRMLAQLTAGLAELWSGLEALAEALLDGKPAEDRERFATGLKRYQEELWKAISVSTRTAATVEEPAGTGHPGPGGPDHHPDGPPAGPPREPDTGRADPPQPA